jgi:hypothetical protein
MLYSDNESLDKMFEKGDDGDADDEDEVDGDS